MACQLLQNMTSGHIKVQKGTGHVFYMATPSHATESVLRASTMTCHDAVNLLQRGYMYHFGLPYVQAMTILLSFHSHNNTIIPSGVSGRGYIVSYLIFVGALVFEFVAPPPRSNFNHPRTPL